MQSLRLLLAGLALACLAPATAQASPFYDATNSQWRMVQPWHHAHGSWRNFQIRLNDCDVLLKRRSKPPASTQPHTIQSWRFDARRVRKSGSNLVCRPGKGSCIKQRIRRPGEAWQTEMVQSVGATVLGNARWQVPLRCTPGYIQAPSGLQWIFRGGNANNPPNVPTNGATITVRDSKRSGATTTQGTPTVACRVSDFGADFIGEVRSAPVNSSARVWAGGGYATTQSMSSGLGNRQVCLVRLGGSSTAQYRHFEYLSGSTPESRWAAVSGAQPPAGAAVMGTLDGNVIHLCTKRHAFKQRNADTGVMEWLTQNYVGWWKPGEGTCHVPPLRSRSSGWKSAGSSVRLLKN